MVVFSAEVASEFVRVCLIKKPTFDLLLSTLRQKVINYDNQKASCKFSQL